MPLGTHQKIFLAWGIFGALGITGFVLAKTTAFENRDEALKARQELRKKLESEK